MFGNIKKRLYFIKMQLLFEKGLKNGNIVPFDDEFYEKISHTYVACLPVSMHIKYLKPLIKPYKCFDRSLYMFFCFENALLVRGQTKSLELRFGEERSEHGWIEMDGYCYDPSLLLRFKRETYYEIYNPYNVSKTTVEEYKNCCDSNKQLYEDIVNTNLSDFQPDGRKRADLCNTIPLIQEIAKVCGIPDLKKELDEYLKLIQYDERQVFEKMNQSFQKCLEEKFKKM